MVLRGRDECISRKKMTTALREDQIRDSERVVLVQERWLVVHCAVSYLIWLESLPETLEWIEDFGTLVITKT